MFLMNIILNLLKGRFQFSDVLYVTIVRIDSDRCMLEVRGCRKFVRAAVELVRRTEVRLTNDLLAI
jgi:hypothetical protein